MGRFVKGDIRPNRIFIADTNIVLYRAGVIQPDKVHEVIDKIVQIITA